MNEAKAITLCIKYKDPAGFDFLVKKFRKEAYFHALGFLGNSEDAADACQEAFWRAFKAIPTLSKLDNFYPWFYSILKNHCLNILSKQSTADKNRSLLSQEQSFFNFDPEVLLQKDETAKITWTILGKMDFEFREILVLKYLQNMDYESISKQLGIPRGTVMSRLYYARKTFKQSYDLVTRTGGGHDRL